MNLDTNVTETCLMCVLVRLLLTSLAQLQQLKAYLQVKIRRRAHHGRPQQGPRRCSRRRGQARGGTSPNNHHLLDFIPGNYDDDYELIDRSREELSERYLRQSD